MQKVETLIIGGGIAGLCCARALQAAGRDWLLLESSDRLGGRVGSDVVDGFTLDRGFQVLLTAYPEAKRQLDSSALQLKAYASGARTATARGWHTLADPRRHPLLVLSSLSHPDLSFADIVATLRWLLTARKASTLPPAAAQSATLDYLRHLGFREPFIDTFWRPFLGGVFLDPHLQRPRLLADFVFQNFAAGRAAIPAKGMQAIPDQLAAALPAERIRTNARVNRIDGNTVHCADGCTIHARTRVLAAPDAQLASSIGGGPVPEFLGTVCDYFVVPHLPEHAAFLHLLAGTPAFTIAFPTALHPQLAPHGQHMASVSHSCSHALDCPQKVLALLRRQMPQAADWTPLHRTVIRNALPAAKQLQEAAAPRPVSANNYIIGDHCGLPSLNSAMLQGRMLGEHLAQL